MNTAPAFILGPHSDEKSFWRRVYEFASRIVLDGALAQVIVKPFIPKRTLRQNARLWAMLTDISEQIPWLVNEELVCMCPEEWKDVLTASLRGELRVARGINGGIVLLGISTSRMNTQMMSDLIELMFAFGNDRGVRWGDDAKAEALPAPAAEVEAEVALA